MLRLNQYESRLAACLVESYQRHSTMKVSDEIEHIRQFWLLTQEK